ncbi:hypothetical protein [Oenococcus oeni]|uniref:Uncharacterized protein n=1 Tax=Oenococcus oeni TaxID=1247 RepID=A0AAQ2ZE07_OENOE|nr:hypothetical protein [Oenococcus oeni]EJN99838.1 hypothetical protein AWRIB418_1573 [Oenococcus oeni AWRIB418]KMQ40005.1 hypothetical protein AAX19_00050 [Oenococcus oeni]OIL38946.1 hypothetical protein ATX11_02430 [Oenococcus oeni]OIL40747.1 hypothetical protein ATX13_09595 [Oenococcus oeni]OLQ37653.1 hypothetical protein ATX28_10660 [Oenococcus oeni]
MASKFPEHSWASAIGKKVDTNELVYLPAMSMRPLNGSMAEYTVAQGNMLVNYLQKLIVTLR